MKTQAHGKTPHTQPPEYIYKICKYSDWKKDKTAYKGNQQDEKDGFIHMSTPSQVERIANKYYKYETDLVLLKVLYRGVQDMVKWEPNSKGDLYPHIYGTLTESHIEEVLPFDPGTFEYWELSEAAGPF